MTDPVQLAKSAREVLAGALNALQSNAHVPDELMEVAEPIAEAMGILHRVERSNGADLEGRSEALGYVRSALDHLQKVSVHHPAVDLVMDAVATSLSKVHALARYAPPGGRPAPPPVPAAPAIAPAPVVQVGGAFPAPAAAFPAPASKPPIDVPPPPGFDPFSMGPPQVAPAPSAPSAPKGFGGTMAMAHPQVAPPNPPSPATPIATPFNAVPAAAFAPQAPPAPPMASTTQPLHQQPAPPSRPAAPHPPPPPSTRAPAKEGTIDVELGTHSASNFYKGLGGNDVIDHGGIFVATYKIPKIGTTVALRVLLPGDLEFQANAVVQWTRDAAGSTEPGFGARFTQISQEGRHLVYRYTRNREPMFYDDL